MPNSIVSDETLDDIIERARAVKGPSDVVPSSAILRVVIEAAFWSSLLFEEGRPALSRLIFSNSMEYACRFDAPIAVSTEQLRKLSPFVETPGLLLQVDASANIGGVVSIGSSAITVHTTAPGRLAVGLSPNVTYVFENSEWIPIHSSPVELMQILDGQFKGLDPVERLMRATTLVDLVRNARRSKRGALLLLTTGPEAASLAARAALRVSSFVSVEDFPSGRDDAASDGDQRERLNQRLLKRSTLREVVAAGAGIDGATILNRELRVVAFAFKIDADLKDDFPVHVMKLPPKPIAPVPRSTIGGMRHQSAACFVRQNREAIAITISQDGCISIFGWEDILDGVLMLRGIERYYETEWSLHVR